MRGPNYNHSFAKVPVADIPRSSFNRSCGTKTTFDAGYLVPVFCDEALPGDTFNCRMTAFARLATPLKPFMDNLYLDSFFFFVPNRLIWNNWQKFNGEQDNPGDSTSFVCPISTAPVGGYGEQSLQDYLGIPTKVAGFTHDVFWTRAYNLIYNQWFRDQNLQNSVTVDKGDGPDTVTNYVLLRRAKRHDYFTSALPWPQKGPAIALPLGTSAPVVVNTAPSALVAGKVFRTDGSRVAAGATALYSSGGADSDRLVDSVNTRVKYDPNGTLITDLSAATAATINQLRQSFQIQKMYERDARGGTRYTEIVKAHFGVTSPDARLQRPEYLGGGSSPVNVNPIAQTSNTPVSGTPQGNLAAMGTSTMSGHGFTKSFTEHGVIIGMVCARADMTYQQGLPRMMSRSTRFDFYWPALSHIGEQSILNKEIYTQGTSADADVFGYQERFAEYRYKPSQITGKFRSNTTGPLDMWHLAQNFLSLPVLNSTFIVENPPLDRVVAVPSEPDFLADFYFDLKCARPMPVFSVPGLIDHF